MEWFPEPSGASSRKGELVSVEEHSCCGGLVGRELGSKHSEHALIPLSTPLPSSAMRHRPDVRGQERLLMCTPVSLQNYRARGPGWQVDVKGQMGTFQHMPSSQEGKNGVGLNVRRFHFYHHLCQSFSSIKEF